MKLMQNTNKITKTALIVIHGSGTVDKCVLDKELLMFFICDRIEYVIDFSYIVPKVL